MAKLPALPSVRSGVAQGLSANESYRQFQATARENGLQGLRRQDYLRLYSETRTAIGRAAAAAAAPRDVLPSGELISDLSTFGKTGYVSWVNVYQRVPGETELIRTPWQIRSDELITPEEAERRAGQAIAQNPYDYERTLVGLGYAGTTRLVPGLAYDETED